ncbi:MAG: DUF4349 domain-containing protein [Burkholderiales bacterium]
MARKVHHEGSLRVRATQPQRALQQATEWTLAAGGYVESLTSQNVVLQIPAARFRSVFDQVASLGEVLAKSLAARDVTDEFLDVAMRLAQGKATRDRLLALIARSTNQNEKLRLLREVERLSADIELLEARMARLQTLVEYSRLALAVEGRKAFEGQPLQEVRGFEWVGALASDLRHDDRDATRFSLTTPVGMVELANTRLWSTASPDGVTLTTQQRRNEPRGSTALWLDALRWRLQDRFAQVEQKSAGEFILLRLVSTEEPGFIFWVAIAAKDDRLYVAQAFFPSGDRELRYETQIMNSLRGGVK